MALIKCPECSHDVSTLAQTCPNCGGPVPMTHDRRLVESRAANKRVVRNLVRVFFWIVAGLIIFALLQEVLYKYSR